MITLSQVMPMTHFLFPTMKRNSALMIRIMTNGAAEVVLTNIIVVQLVVQRLSYIQLKWFVLR